MQQQWSWIAGEKKKRVKESLRLCVCVRALCSASGNQVPVAEMKRHSIWCEMMLEIREHAHERHNCFCGDTHANRERGFIVITIVRMSYVLIAFARDSCDLESTGTDYLFISAIISFSVEFSQRQPSTFVHWLLWLPRGSNNFGN